jgi:multiple sugar transport system permease protein
MTLRHRQDTLRREIVSGDGARKPDRPPRRLRVPARLVPVVLLAPALALLSVFVLLPMIAVIGLSLFDYNLLAGTTQYVGLANYHMALQTGELQQALSHTLLYWLLTVPAIVGLGLLAALGINSLARGQAFWRTVYFLPTASTLAAMSIVWAWMFYPDTGLVDETIGRLTGLTGWLNSTTLALPAVAIVGVWQATGVSVIMFLAGLSNVNPDVLDAARLDRAGSWHRFWHVTFPALGPSLVFTTVLATKSALSVFDQIQVMTQGGPAQSSTTLSFLMWQQAITFNDVGVGSVISVVLLVVVILATFAQLRSFGRRWEQAGAR